MHLFSEKGERLKRRVWKAAIRKGINRQNNHFSRLLVVRTNQKKPMKKILASVVLTLIVLILGFVAYIYSGSYDISQLTPHNALTKWAIRTTTHHSIEARIKDIQVPALNDSSMIIEGFGHFQEMCVTCHAAPGKDADELVEGLYPKPPKIYKFADHLEPKETFWVIKNGIKMTSMPAFGPTHSDEKIWAITAFVTQKLAKMSPQEYQDWSQEYAGHDEAGE